MKQTENMPGILPGRIPGVRIVSCQLLPGRQLVLGYLPPLGPREIMSW